MSLTLHYHPLASYCWKALIALYETGLPFEGHIVDLGDPASRAAFLVLWPTGKMPLLVDDDAVFPESSIVIERIDQLCPGSLLPADPGVRLQVRLWDRLFDNYVMDPMQAIVAERLRPADAKDPTSVASAHATLAMAYPMIDRQLQGHAWAVGETFTIADCAAAPSLFYAATLAPLPPELPALSAYFERLMARPSVVRVLKEAGPYLKYYPFYDQVPERFRVG